MGKTKLLEEIDCEKVLIDKVGFEAHLTTGQRPQQLEEAFNECTKNFEPLHLPIEITELDIAKDVSNVHSSLQNTKQSALVNKIVQMIKSGKINAITAWSQSDEMSFLNDKSGGKNVEASVILDGDCNEKAFEGPEAIKSKYQIMASQIGKSTIHTVTSAKDKAMGIVRKYLDKFLGKEEKDPRKIIIRKHTKKLLKY